MVVEAAAELLAPVEKRGFSKKPFPAMIPSKHRSEGEVTEGRDSCHSPSPELASAFLLPAPFGGPDAPSILEKAGHCPGSLPSSLS